MKRLLIVFLISMVPLIELRGAIPYAVGFGIPIVPACIVAVLGNMLPVPFIFLFARRLLEWGKDKKVIGPFFTWCLQKGEKGGKKLESKAGRGLYVALLLSSASPSPGRAHGPEPWPRACWTWISKRACSMSSAGCFSPASSCSLPPTASSERFPF